MAAKPAKSSDILDAVALLVVDMQRSFLDVIEGAPAVIERCGFAIEAARALGLRVIFTEQVPAKLGPTDPRLHALVPGARVFAKNTFSALQADGLRDYLKRQGIYHLLIAGIEIPVCVYQTALHACDSDFDVTVLSDCVTGRRLEDCLVTLDALTRANCHVLPAESVYYSMLGNSAHPLFSAYNALVKRYNQPGGLDAAPPPPELQSHQPERRPRLAAPEDRADASDVEEPSDLGDAPGEDEPYIGHNLDEAPAGNADAGSADDDERTAPLRSVASEDDEETSESEMTADEGDESESSDGSSGSPDDAAGGDGAPGRRRRGRRRRGGARRRRARERTSTGAGSSGEGRPTEAPPRESPPPAGAPETGPGEDRDVGSPGDERTPE